ncbi:hypothetical protein N7470_000835 [Penicillium chermesinum]|nr:hypothetical protein N7470_000835 [Penicillium chermesinum]
MTTIQRNPKDSMTSTWRKWDRAKWTPSHWLLEVLDAHHVELDEDVPVFQKTDKVPYAPELQFHLWVLTFAGAPLALHQLYINYIGQPSAWLVFLFYSMALKLFAVHEVHILRRLGHQIGFFDGDKHARDGVPDVGVGKTVQTILSVIAFRPMLATFISYTGEPPSSIRWGWLIIETGMYALTLDFWYYMLHRSAHEIGALWQFHRTHHLTKHPNPLLTAKLSTLSAHLSSSYGTLKLLGFPMGFYEWWICQQYVVFTEVLGHSGLRMLATAVNPWTSLWRMLDMELVIEDHDLHHRKGWKNSHNYGKQTRVWDRLFKTWIPRVEGYPENIDYVNTVKLPLF